MSSPRMRCIRGAHILPSDMTGVPMNEQSSGLHDTREIFAIPRRRWPLRRILRILGRADTHRPEVDLDAKAIRCGDTDFSKEDIRPPAVLDEDIIGGEGSTQDWIGSLFAAAETHDLPPHTGTSPAPSVTAGAVALLVAPPEQLAPEASPHDATAHQSQAGDMAPPGSGAAKLEEPPLALASVPHRNRRRSLARGLQRARSVLADVIMWLIALTGLLAMAITITASVTGIRPVIIRSGSMEPAIATGSVVLVRPVTIADLTEGQIVSVVRPDGIRVTHRIVSARVTGDQAELVLKGDANEKEDPVPVLVKQAHQVIATLPQLGWVAAHVATPIGGFALGCAITAGGLAPRLKRRTSQATR